MLSRLLSEHQCFRPETTEFRSDLTDGLYLTEDLHRERIINKMRSSLYVNPYHGLLKAREPAKRIETSFVEESQGSQGTREKITKPIRIPQSTTGQFGRLTEVRVIVVWNKKVLVGLYGQGKKVIGKKPIDNDLHGKLCIIDGIIREDESPEETGVRLLWQISGLRVKERNLNVLRRNYKTMTYYVEYDFEPNIIGPSQELQSRFIQSNQLAKDFETQMIMSEREDSIINTGLTWININILTGNTTLDDGELPDYVKTSPHLVDIIYLRNEHFYS